MLNQNPDLHGPLATAFQGDAGSPVIGENGEILGVPRSSVPLALYSPNLDLDSVASASVSAPSAFSRGLGTSNDDVFVGGEGRDHFNGWGGQDQAFGGGGGDRLRGGAGDDYLHGGAGRDRLNGGSGQDQLIGGSGNDVVVGGDGDDRLYGQSGNDRLRGGQGQDKLDGGTGRDRLFGGSGDDRLTDKDGGDVLTGGDGNDQFWIGDGDQGLTTIKDFQTVRDQIKLMPLGMTYEQLEFAAQGRDTLISFQNQPLVRLQNVDRAQLNPSDFRFGNASLITGLQEALDVSPAPGATLAVVTADGSTWSGAAGLARLEDSAPMMPDSRMDIGSITKTMVAVTALQLMQEGQLSLDDTLGQWLPQTLGRIENAEMITLRQLLNHSSGVAENIESGEFATALAANPARIWTPDDLLQFAYDKPSDFSPGESFNYSNTNYTLLGMIVSSATGETMAAQMRSRIFEPLGMEDSFLVSQEASPGGFLPGYMDLQKYGLADQSQLVSVPFHHSSRGFAHGGGVSTVGDLSRFAQALHNGELLTPTTMELRRTESVVNPNQPDVAYGLGIRQFTTPVGEVVGHTGTFPGAESSMFFLPDQGLTVVTMANQDIESDTFGLAVQTLLSPVVDGEPDNPLPANRQQGSSGDDLLVGTEDDDILAGSSGQDRLLSGDGQDRLQGGDGDDYLHGGAGRDRLNGGDGQDQLMGGSGDDVLAGGDGDDRLYGQSGNDRLRGGQGQDQLDGGNGRDRLFGGSGDDRLTDKDGGDVLTGGDGNDQFWIGNGDQGVTRIRDFQAGRDRIKFLELGTTYDQLSFTRRGNDTLVSVGADKRLRLKNINPHQLSQRDFQFGDASLIANLQAALQSSTKPGAALSVVTPDGSFWSGANGFENLEAGTAMSADSRSGIGSITKTMTAVTTLQLMQEGKLSLDDTLAQWLPQVVGKIENSETITLRQLLNHSSGIPEMLDDDFEAVLLDNPNFAWQPEDFISFVYGETARFEPGDRYSYSNTNYVLLALVIEASTSETLAEQFATRIFDPLGMDNSSIVTTASTPEDFPQGYIDFAAPEYNGLSDVSQLIPVPFHPSVRGFGEGGAVSTVLDLTRFSQALNNGELLAPQTFMQMQQDIAPTAGEEERYGLGITLPLTPFGTFVGHDGGFPGVNSNMFYAPEQQITVVTIENQLEGDSPLFVNAIAALLES